MYCIYEYQNNMEETKSLLASMASMLIISEIYVTTLCGMIAAPTMHFKVMEKLFKHADMRKEALDKMAAQHNGGAINY